MSKLLTELRCELLRAPIKVLTTATINNWAVNLLEHVDGREDGRGR
jgi:hypothetical protein